ncbi:hypothetical protein EDB86DRAFT_3079629 [Lactarius hatsudake]|nr:hypothetical protein EDB86DRAFT_3079629 [Lactarius hatsudake]
MAGFWAGTGPQTTRPDDTVFDYIFGSTGVSQILPREDSQLTAQQHPPLLVVFAGAAKPSPRTQNDPGAAHLPHHEVPSAGSPLYQVTHGTEEAMMTSESGLMFSSVARLSSSVVMRHVPSAVSERVPVGNGKTQSIRTPRKFADEANVVLDLRSPAFLSNTTAGSTLQPLLTTLSLTLIHHEKKQSTRHHLPLNLVVLTKAIKLPLR